MRLPEELRKRTREYAGKVVRLYSSLPTRRREVEVVGHQLLRSGTSVAAHAREASRARSDSEFCSKLGGLLQEADESALWLELLQKDCQLDFKEIPLLKKETEELIAIFTTMNRKVRDRL